MKRNKLPFRFTLLIFILSLLIGCSQEKAKVQNIDQTAELTAKSVQVLNSQETTPKLIQQTDNLLPIISFEKTVCDLGDVGQDTKNTCEFKFTNTGQGLLRIGNIKRTCGCTVI
jgi:PBP1b-binding outer membrane lipoprotein LpoB